MSSNKIASGIVWSIILNIVNSIYSFFSVPILLSYFGKTEYGIIGLANSVNIYMGLLDLGLGTTNARFYANWISIGRIKDVNRLFRTSLSFFGIVGLINALVLTIIAVFADSIFQLNGEQCIILRTLLFILVFSSIISWVVSSLNQIIYADENVAWMRKRDLIVKIYMILVLGATVLFKFSLFWYFLLTTFSFLIVVPTNVNKIRKSFGFISFKPSFDKEILKEVMPYCLSIFSFGFFQFVFRNIGPVFLGMRGTIEMVADYRVMNGIVCLVNMLTNVFMGSLLPSTYKVVAVNNQEAKERLAYDGTRYISIFICFCAFGMMSISSDLLCLYVGESYLYLIPVLNVWLFTTTWGHMSCVASIVMAGANVKPLAYISFVQCTVGLLMSWFLIPYLGIGAVVLSLVIYLIIEGLFYYTYYMNRVLNINPKKVFFSYIPYVFAAFVVLYVTQLINLNIHIYNLFMKGTLFAVIYLAVVYFILRKKDRVYLFSIVKKLFNKS